MPAVWSSTSVAAISQSIHNYSWPHNDEAAMSPCFKFEECTQCGTSSGLSETLGESMDSGSPHLLVISVPVSVPVPISIAAFPCFPVAPILVYFGNRPSHYY